MSPEEEYKAWLAKRPPSIQALAAEFPHGSVFHDVSGDKLYLIGYNEGDVLIVSTFDPFENYAGALAAARYVHAQCMREVLIKP